MNLDPAALGRRFGELRMSWLLAIWLAATTAIALNRGISLLWGMVWLLVAAMVVSSCRRDAARDRRRRPRVGVNDRR